MGNTRKTARQWLQENGYPEVAEMISDIQAEWKLVGKHTRRNWWEVLAGGKNGSPRTIYGRQFPVLQAAQIRQGKEVTPNALKVSESEEVAPAISVNGRWKLEGKEGATLATENETPKDSKT